MHCHGLTRSQLSASAAEPAEAAAAELAATPAKQRPDPAETNLSDKAAT